ncbi:MAG: ATP-binding protein, partial [Anaerolineae bacterium]
TPESTYQEMWQTILRGEVWQGELVNRTKLGMHYDASLTVAPIYNEQGEMTGFVGIQSDISRLKNVDRLKSQFITDVSHELRTPVTNLKLYTDLLMRTPAEKHGRYFEVLQIQVSRLEQIIEDILTLSRLEGNRLNLEPNPVDINMIAAQSVKTLQSKAKAAGLAVNFMPYPSAELVCSEPALLRQLINSLAQNAINYTSEGKVDIIISQPPDSGFVELVVKDTGAGIDAEERPFIFDRFFRGKIASHSNISGSGLGLTIVREIVELLDGKIELESELGKGTKVTVRLKTVAASRLCH